MRSLALLLFVAFSPSALATTWYVSPAGSDSAAGTSPATAFKTLQKAANVVAPGDTVVALPGTYAGFNLFTSGTAAAPITFTGNPGVAAPNPLVVVNANNGFTNKDRINLEGASHVIVEGFTVIGTGDPLTSRACIRAVGSVGTSAKHVTVRHNRCDLGGYWGVFTGFVDDLVVEGNECSHSAKEHGIYASNSGDRPVIRGNVIFSNHANGIHLNGDLSQGGDGIISDALIENNVIYDNGTGGGSGINGDGIQGATIRNNLLFGNHASGISLYRIDAGGPAKNNIVVANTIVNAADSRWALNIQDGAINNQVRDNILFNDHPSHGAIDVSTNSLPGLVSDYNVVKDLFSIGGTFVSFAQWKAQTGQDAHSKVATPAATFASVASGDYRLKSTSPAVDAGTSVTAPPFDLLMKPRPALLGFDCGAYEFASCFGSVAKYGSGLAGSGGLIPTIGSAGCPDLGDALTIVVTPSVAGAPGMLFFGTQMSALPAFGGTLLLLPLQGAALSGAAQIAFTVPSDPALQGFSGLLQAFYADAQAPQGVAISAGAKLTIG